MLHMNLYSQSVHTMHQSYRDQAQIALKLRYIWQMGQSRAATKD